MDTVSTEEILITGLLELCKTKLPENDAIRWLGEWLIDNNPKNKNKWFSLRQFKKINWCTTLTWVHIWFFMLNVSLWMVCIMIKEDGFFIDYTGILVALQILLSPSFEISRQGTWVAKTRIQFGTKLMYNFFIPPYFKLNNILKYLQNGLAP